MFKLNLKLYCCCSILSLETNQKHFKYTFQQFIFYVLNYDAAASFLKKQDIPCHVELWQKVNSYE